MRDMAHPLDATQLYGQPRDGWLDRPLSLIGETRFTGCDFLARSISYALRRAMNVLDFTVRAFSVC